MSFLDKDTFQTVIASTPLVSIDLLIENSKGQYLLGYRNNRPAKGFWFVPGGRILKNETMDDAFKRLTLDELGRSLSRKSADFLGSYEHFYDDCVFGEGVATHYVVMGYKLKFDIDISTLPCAQHNNYEWFEKSQMMSNDAVHIHSKWYIE